VFYDTLHRPPPPGSLQETVCALIYEMRCDQEFAKTLALLSEGKKRADAFSKYKTLLYPYYEQAEMNWKKFAKDALDRAYKLGPLGIRRVSRRWN
jgi:hypothetical protein